MSIKENKSLVKRSFDLLMRKDEAFFDLLTRDYIGHYGDRDLSLEEEKNLDHAFLAAFSDAVATIGDMVAEGDKVAYRVTWRATHTGEFMGIAPTGKKIKLMYSAIFRISGGKLAEWWGVGEDLYQQLGAIPKQ